jgi:glycosyltransferase involved in cell wall biosynthesis
MISTVTVLMTVYNEERYIESGIRSILNQTYTDFEFLIIDDGSTDKTETIIQSFSDSRIRYVKIDRRGRSNALNHGFKIASNDWIFLMDADDISLPHRFERQIGFSKTLTKEFIISCSYAVFENCKLKFLVNVKTIHDELRKRLALHSELINSGLFLNRQTVLNAGGYHDNVFEDYELLLRLKDKICFMNVDEILLLVRYRGDSYSRKNMREKNKIIYEFQKPYYEKDLSKEFNLERKNINEIKGWREYFYGNKNRARYYWKKYGLFLVAMPGVLTAYLISFLPEKTFIKFREKRWRFRLNYLLNYFSKDNKLLRKFLKQNCN